MPEYNPGPAIIESSFAELQKIVSWINEPGEEPARTKTVLIGGWAVDAYNPYFGSVDIDLVADRNTQQWLIDRLRSNEGYQHHTRYPSDTVKKETPHGDIILDFISRETQYPFEGHPEVPFSFEILSGNTVFRNVRQGAYIQVPNRSMLVLLKLKAAWDRSYRILHQTSPDTRYEGHKLIKDYADVLALIDPDRGGREINLEILGDQISRVGFLKDIIVRISDIDAVRERYETMTQQEIQKVCEDFVSIL